jgi:hypothetical protein
MGVYRRTERGHARGSQRADVGRPARCRSSHSAEHERGDRASLVSLLAAAPKPSRFTLADLPVHRPTLEPPPNAHHESFPDPATQFTTCAYPRATARVWLGVPSHQAQ